MPRQKEVGHTAQERTFVTKSGGDVLLMMALTMGASLSAPGAGDKNDVSEIGNRKIAHRSIISQEKEVAIGKQLVAEIDRSAKLINDPVITEYVNRMAQNLARNSDLTIPLTVTVIDDPTINAMTLPGGFIYVNSGVLVAADEEDQLAGVLAHEIAYAAARHWASQATRSTLLQYATLPLIFAPLSYPVYLGISQALNYGVPLTFLKFSRSAEAEADFLGLQYMYKAGYDPNSYVTFFGKVLQEERGSPGSVPKVFLDHPPTPERMVKSEQEINEILPKRDQYLVSTSEFDDIKARLKTQITNLRKQEKPGPTLQKREAADNDTAAPDQPKGQDTDQPPVLRRRD